jgi:hypothetical protein
VLVAAVAVVEQLTLLLHHLILMLLELEVETLVFVVAVVGLKMVEVVQVHQVHLLVMCKDREIQAA